MRCRSGYRYETGEPDVRNNRWFVTKKRVVFHPPKFAYRKLEMRARVGHCVPPGQKRVPLMDEKIRKKTLKRRENFADDNVWDNPKVLRRLDKYAAEERAAREAAERAAAARRAARAPKQIVTRRQAQPWIGRLRGG